MEAHPQSEENILEFFRQGYTDFIRLKAFQLDSMLTQSVDTETIMGEELNLHSYNQVQMVDRTAVRNVANNPQSMPRESRKILPGFFEYTEQFDPRDTVRTMRQLRPDGQFTRSVLGAVNRLHDCLINDGFEADVTGGTGTPFQFDVANQVVLAEFNSAAAGSDQAARVEQFIEARVILMENDVNQGVRWYVAIHPRAVGHLLANVAAETPSTLLSWDFNALRPLMSGMITEFLGMTWIPTTVKITHDMAESESLADVEYFWSHCYAQTAVVLGRDANVEIHFDIIPDLGHSLQVAHYVQSSAIRFDESQIVRVESDGQGEDIS